MTALDEATPAVASGPAPSARGRRTWLVLGSLVAVVSIGFTGMWIVSAVAHRTETFRRHFDGAAIDVVDIAVDSGDVHVTGGPSTEIDLRQRVTEGLFGTGHRATVVGRRLVVRGSCRVFWSTHCAVDVTVSVPAGVHVIVSTDNGLNEVTGVSGGAELSTDNGTIETHGVSGDLSMTSDNGDILAAAVSSANVQVRTDNGDVGLSFASPPSSLRTASDNGDVTVDLPGDGTAYDLHTSTDNGAVSTPIRTDPTSGRSIRATSDNGDITIRYR